MTILTVKDLRAALFNLPDEMQVVIAKYDYQSEVGDPKFDSFANHAEALAIVEKKILKDIVFRISTYNNLEGN